MCGIVGYIRLDDVSADRMIVRAMVHALKHRGPDAQTEYLDGPVGFGHARLSIIDLAGGNQPLFNEDRSVSVICNGEIYNYREIRQHLVKCGHQFRTGSDCEVLAHLWEESGPAMVDQLRGMFAFVLYDRNQSTIFGARDRFGQKPLYYHYDPARFSFSSEIKGLLELPDISRDLDLLALDQFLFHQFVPQPSTLFQSIKKLPAGCCFQVTLPAISDPSEPSGGVTANPWETTGPRAEISGEPQGKITHSASPGSSLRIWQYWQPRFQPDEVLTPREHLDRVEAGLIDAVQSHMVADVPVGVFLSGGIDSSLITALASRFNQEPLETFSITFPGSEHDEASVARSVAKSLRTKHHEFPFQPDDLQKILTDTASLFDQPLADTAVLPLLALSRAASEFVKVVLTGDGGDELFAGYRKYRRMMSFPGRFRWLAQACANAFPMHELSACRPDSMRLRQLCTRVAMLISPQSRSEYHRQGWEGWERFELYRPEIAQFIDGRFSSLRMPNRGDFSHLAPLNAALELDQGTILADRLLLKGDTATMAFGLEARAPLLDHHLADIAAKLPLSLKATASKTKVALRDVASRYLPADVVSRRKKGFSMPLDRWLRKDLVAWTRSCLLEDSVALPRFFQRRTIERLLKEHVAGRNHSGRIHTLLTFELWCREFGQS